MAREPNRGGGRRRDREEDPEVQDRPVAIKLSLINS